MRVILASKSPRRSEILKNLGLDFEIITADTDETSDIKTPELLVKELAKRKGSAVLKQLDTFDGLVISADTVVVVDDEILGKPKDKYDAFNMLKKLSGRAHRVISGISLSLYGKTVTDFEETFVYFSELSDSQIEKYVATNEPNDKAGAYAVQGIASLWIDKIDGCYFNVVGFPTRLFYKLLIELGVNYEDLVTDK